MVHMRGGIKGIGKNNNDSAAVRKKEKEIRRLKGDLQQVCTSGCVELSLSLNSLELSRTLSLCLFSTLLNSLTLSLSLSWTLLNSLLVENTQLVIFCFISSSCFDAFHVCSISALTHTILILCFWFVGAWQVFENGLLLPKGLDRYSSGELTVCDLSSTLRVQCICI